MIVKERGSEERGGGGVTASRGVLSTSERHLGKRRKAFSSKKARGGKGGGPKLWTRPCCWELEGENIYAKGVSSKKFLQTILSKFAAIR